MLLFAGAMFTLWQTNRAADRRAHQSWRGDAELRAVADILAVSSEAIYRLRGFMAINHLAAEDANDKVVAASEKISVRAAELRLLADSDIPALCDKLSTAL
ncbi:hypothetical protein [Nocardia fluminea]|uniref:hypothetical protein n=1 Tax=Nocardia fluminea TaxID=134984 RepID=UPI00343A2D83